jgi:hypothetical protein
LESDARWSAASLEAEASSPAHWFTGSVIGQLPSLLAALGFLRLPECPPEVGTVVRCE